MGHAIAAWSLFFFFPLFANAADETLVTKAPYSYILKLTLIKKCEVCGALIPYVCAIKYVQ